MDYRNSPSVMVPVDVDLYSRLWTPDTYFYDLVSLEDQVVLGRKVSGLWVATDGTVLYSQETSADVRCQSDLTNFPMDVQTCLVS